MAMSFSFANKNSLANYAILSFGHFSVVIDFANIYF